MGPSFHSEERPLWLILYRLVERMQPWQRVAWLQGCCRLASVGADPVRLTSCRGEADECWMAYRSIAGQGRLDVERAGKLASRISRS